MNSGRSFGRQRHFDFGQRRARRRTPEVLPAGDLSWLRKCSGTLHADRLILVDAEEIQVQQLRLERMLLHVAQQHFLALPSTFRSRIAEVEPLVARGQAMRVVLELDVLRRIARTVDDGGHEAGTTQAAARTFPLVRAALRRDFMDLCHFSTYLVV